MLVKYIVSRFPFAELFLAEVDASGDAMQSGTVCIDGGEVDVVVGGAAELSVERSVPQPASAKATRTMAARRVIRRAYFA